MDAVSAGYGAREILHGIEPRIATGQLSRLIRLKGAGKSTILHAIFGLTNIHAGR